MSFPSSVESSVVDDGESRDSAPSFLRPRDPSREPYGRGALPPPRGRNLREAFGDELTSADDDQHLRVYLRIKPTGDGGGLDARYELEPNAQGLTVACPHDDQTNNGKRARSVKRRYRFTGVFANERNAQRRVFDAVARDDLAAFVEGGEGGFTVVAYGASGSGKTYSLMGTAEEPGLIPRCLEALFVAVAVDRQPRFKPTDGDGHAPLNAVEREAEIQEIQRIMKSCGGKGIQPGIPPESSFDVSTYHRMSVALLDESTSWRNLRKNKKKYEVWVSFAEIYNESIFDLLRSDSNTNRPPPNLRLVHLAKGQTYIKGIKWVCVRNGTEAYAALEKGRSRLRYAHTQINSNSSRSHCLFSMKLLQYDADLCNVKSSTFRLCDLAGTERAKRTGNEGVRLNESRSINSSLHVLEKCLMSLRSQKYGQVTVPPYRESKLTSLLQNALSGNEAIAMLVTINPDQTAFAETQHTLQFSSVAKEIVYYVDHKLEQKSQSCLDLSINRSSDFSIDTSNEISYLQDEIKRLKMEADIRVEQNERKIRREMFETFTGFENQTKIFHEEALKYEREKYAELKQWQENMLKAYNTEVDELASENRKLRKRVELLENQIKRMRNDYHSKSKHDDTTCVPASTQYDIEYSLQFTEPSVNLENVAHNCSIRMSSTITKIEEHDNFDPSQNGSSLSVPPEICINTHDSVSENANTFHSAENTGSLEKAFESLNFQSANEENDADEILGNSNEFPPNDDQSNADTVEFHKKNESERDSGFSMANKSDSNTRISNESGITLKTEQHETDVIGSKTESNYVSKTEEIDHSSPKVESDMNASKSEQTEIDCIEDETKCSNHVSKTDYSGYEAEISNNVSKNEQNEIDGIDYKAASNIEPQEINTGESKADGINDFSKAQRNDSQSISDFQSISDENKCTDCEDKINEHLEVSTSICEEKMHAKISLNNQYVESEPIVSLEDLIEPKVTPKDDCSMEKDDSNSNIVKPLSFDEEDKKVVNLCNYESKKFSKLKLKRRGKKSTEQEDVQQEPKTVNLEVTPEKPKGISFATPKQNSAEKENLLSNKFYTEFKEKSTREELLNTGCTTVGGSRRKLFARRQNNEMAAELKEPPKSSKHLNFDEESPGVTRPPKVEKPYTYETRSARSRARK